MRIRVLQRRKGFEGKRLYLEGLIPHEDVAIQSEAQLPALEEQGICLRQLAICTPETLLSSAKINCPP